MENKKEGRRYSEAFKALCAADRQSGKTIARIAREYGVPYKTVRRWCNQKAGKIPRVGYDGRRRIADRTSGNQ